MSGAYTKPLASEEFGEARRHFAAIEQWLTCSQSQELEHSKVEERLVRDGQELMRRLLQGHLDLRRHTEQRLDSVQDCHGHERPHVEHSERGLTSVFGPVRVGRLAYRAKGQANLHPADAVLNLPPQNHSHGLRRRVAQEASHNAYDEVVSQVARYTGGKVAKRQAEALVVRAAQDFDDFYASSLSSNVGDAIQPSAKTLLVLSHDGKGIVMRPDSLRQGTRRAAQRSRHKLQCRLSIGEKRHRKRMARVTAVYDVEPIERQIQDVLAELGPVQNTAKPRPQARNKRVWASVQKDTIEATCELFDEALRRDPDRRRNWVALVDGDWHQIQRMEAEACRRGVKVEIVVDFIHVLEYLWKAVWCFHKPGDAAAEKWVHQRATKILKGQASHVAAGIRKSATLRKLDKKQRRAADACATYLLNKRIYLAYDRYLPRGYPIATGVIEGACRHLVNDRMGITGARWRVLGAEAILSLRSLRCSGDFDAYWDFHLQNEKSRIHMSRFKYEAIPRAA